MWADQFNNLFHKSLVPFRQPLPYEAEGRRQTALSITSTIMARSTSFRGNEPNAGDILILKTLSQTPSPGSAPFQLAEVNGLTRSCLGPSQSQWGSIPAEDATLKSARGKANALAFNNQAN